MAPFSKPETVLKQAEGLVSVGQSHAALQSLTEMFSSKRFRSTPLASLEPIMLRFVELCVEMRKGRTAKEGLMQYKNIAQNTSVGSIEVVIKKFVALADAKVQEAQEKAEKAVALVDVDDLEASETPESILLGAVSGDQNKDRTDRALVTPWLKFLWESYRTALETLKNNARLEGIYQQIAQQAFKFCLKHQRKVEFRRLCETLRLHLANVAKYAHQPHSINLGDADTLQHHLDTRFAQLNTSVELELWQEAFRSVEDIHNLLNMAKKSPRPAMMANYYEKLTRIFLTSGNALFHAAAWARYYSIVRSAGGKTDEELSRLAGQVLISALAVPVGHASEEDEVRGRTARLTALLGLTKTPTRTGLLKEALSRNVLRLAPKVVKDLYNILEVTFDPLLLCSNVVPLLKDLSSDPNYASYLPLLQRALLSRLLAQLAQVYSTMEVSRLLELVTPLHGSFEGAYEAPQVEAFLMACARSGDLRVRIDHASGSLTFIDEAFGSPVAGSSTAILNALDKSVQPSASELVRTRLSSVATCLHNALIAINPPPSEAEKEKEDKEKLAQLVAVANAERKALQVRRAIVARRRELISELSVRKEKEEASRRAEASRREKDEAARRAMEDMRKKQEERLRRDRENFDKEEARKLAQELKEKNILKVDVDDLGDLNRENLLSLQVQQIEKEKKDQSERLRIIAKRLDHTERAFRKEERPLLAQDYEQQQVDDRRAFEESQKSRLEAAKLAHQMDLDTKKRLSRMMDDYKKRKDVYVSRRGEEFVKRRKEAERKVEEEKSKRRAAVLKAREEERKREEEEERIRSEQEEEERRLEEERIAEEKRQLEEEEAAKAEAEEKARKEEEQKAEARRKREEERKLAEERAKLQRQREEEAEARLLARRNAPPPSSQQPGGGRADSPAGAWRRSGATPPGGATPTRQANATPPPPAVETPSTAGKYVPGAFRRGGAPATAGTGGGWRAREAARATTGAGAVTPERPASPAVGAAAASGGAEAKEGGRDEDGFQTVSEKKVWRPTRGRGGGEVGAGRGGSNRW